MIVDDDHIMVKLLQTLLELDGFDVSVARQGSDVISVATETQPDVLLMDYHLTDTTGVEVLKELRASATFANLPVIIASGMNVEDEVIAAGANAFLVKPFEPNELPRLFNQFIG